MLSHLVLSLGVLVTAFPIWITFVASTHPVEALMAGRDAPVARGPISSRTTATVLGTGMEAAGSVPVGMMMWNSLVMALMIAVGKIAISIIAAYAIVYFRFPLRMTCFWIIFVTLMLPVEVRILPTFGVVANLGMLNTYWGLSVPLIASATATFLFRQFFLTVPEELAEAARIDGGGPAQVLPRHPPAALAHQHRGVLRDPLHLRLEPVPVAAPRHHRRELLHDRHGHPADAHRTGLRAGVAPGHGDRRCSRCCRPCSIVIFMQRLFVKGLIEQEK